MPITPQRKQDSGGKKKKKKSSPVLEILTVKNKNPPNPALDSYGSHSAFKTQIRFPFEA